MRALPYNLTDEQMVPETSSLKLLGESSLPTLFQMLAGVQHKLDAPERRRVWEAALALYPHLVDMDVLEKYDRVDLFRVAFDTAMIWEFG